MKILKYIPKVVFVLAVLVASSCKESLTEINENPNGVDPNTANPNLLMPTVMSGVGTQYLKLGYGRIAGVVHGQRHHGVRLRRIELRQRRDAARHLHTLRLRHVGVGMRHARQHAGETGQVARRARLEVGEALRDQVQPGERRASAAAPSAARHLAHSRPPEPPTWHGRPHAATGEDPGGATRVEKSAGQRPRANWSEVQGLCSPPSARLRR